MNVKTNGIVYLGFGSVYLAKALVSAETARFHNPDLPICIVTNIKYPGSGAFDFWRDGFDEWLYINDRDERNRRYKTNIVSYVAFSKAIYLDCDTLVTGSLALAWRLLDYFDIAFKFQGGKQKHKHLAAYEPIPGVPISELSHWNGGVVLFNNSEAVASFFSRWMRKFEESGLEFDQPSLVQAIFESNIKLLSLDERWNGGYRELDRDGGGLAKVIHYHSMFDSQLQRALLNKHRVLELAGLAEKNAMGLHVKERNQMRMRREPVKFWLRRMYRWLWYVRNKRTLEGKSG